MYRDSYQHGLLTIFFSCGSKPLKIWDTYTQNGYITKFLDEDIKSTVLEIGGSNVSTTYMICPKGKQVLGITMPFLVMIVKNIKKYFSFEITILDDTGTRRRFRVANFQSTTQILPMCTVMPISLSDGWNQIQFNMSDFCRRAYQKQFVEVQKCKINANIRIRRIYFAEKIYAEENLPAEYKLFIPLKKRPAKGKPKTDAEVVAPEKVPAKTAPASRVQEEKRSSKVLQKPPSLISIKSAIRASVTEGAPDQTMATEEPIATGEELVAAAEEPVAAAEEPVAAAEEPVAAGGETDAAVEGGPDQGDAATTEPVAAAEEPITEAEAPAATGETPAIAEAATETTEPIKEKSVEAATQYYDPVSVEDKATDAAVVAERTGSVSHLETIEEQEN